MTKSKNKDKQIEKLKEDKRRNVLIPYCLQKIDENKELKSRLEKEGKDCKLWFDAYNKLKLRTKKELASKEKELEMWKDKYKIIKFLSKKEARGMWASDIAVKLNVPPLCVMGVLSEFDLIKKTKEKVK